MRKIHSLIAICFLSTVLVLSCKDDDVPVDPNIITQEYYFQAVLDGDTVTYQEELADYTNIVGDFYGQEAANGYAYSPFTCIAKSAAATNPIPSVLAKSGAVGIVKVSSTQANTLALYAGLITTGTLPVGYLPRDSSQTGVDGVFISIFDADGVEWNTNNGPLGSGNLVVTEYNTEVDNTRIPATQRVIAATFSNMNVYNATGQSKLVTGGKVRGRIILWQ
jgi:hypothetical protein